MVLSTHRVEVVRLGPVAPHPNADALGLVNVFGYQCVVRLGEWAEGDLAAYIVPDSLVPTNRPEFSFLARPEKPRPAERIKVRKLRGIFSQGLLVRAPEGTREGDDVAALFGVTRYEPPEPLATGGDVERGPKGDRPHYDVESFRRYAAIVFREGEEVVATEKVHGANARFTWHDNRLYCGSRRQWKKEEVASAWWRVARQYQGVTSLLESFPGATLYGEVYGQVQDLTYGTKKGEIRFAAFDLLRTDGTWLPVHAMRQLCESFGVPLVPVIYAGPLDTEKMLALAEGPSLLGPNVREGIVVRPVEERWHQEVGRVQLKVVGNSYLEKA